MNKIEILANEKFAGDLTAAIVYVMDNFDSEQLNEYVLEFNREQSDIFLGLLSGRINKYIPDNQKRRIVEENFDLAKIDLSKEEVNQMEVNPYKAKIGKDLLKLLIINGGLISVNLLSGSIGSSLLGENFFQFASSVSMILSSVVSLSTSKDLLNYFKFKKIKDKSLNEDVGFERGRSL